MEHPVPYQPQQQPHHPQDYAYDYNRAPPAKHRPRDEDGPMHPPPFAPYPDQPEHDRDSAGGDDSDSDDTLSFQTLNADGTPKRPMNAFLLYAKKRRPQISTSHPTMRTGEISKVLSKEWQGMNKGEKQYYQDKAKKLKDTFNVRWPDYVYKRRPNNSRKKRRGNPSPDSPVIDEAVPPEGEPGVEPVPGAFPGEEPNPEEVEGSPDAAARLPHERPHQDERIAPGTYASQPTQGDPRGQPQHRTSVLPDPGPAINPRLGYAPSSAAPPNYPPYDESYSYPSYYSQPGQPQGPSPRLPPVWAHEGGRPPYEGDRSSSAPSAPPYPNGGPDDGQWSTRPGGSSSGSNGNSMNPSWSSLVNPQNSHPGQMPRTVSRNHSLSSQSPIPSPTDNSYSLRRPRNWPHHSPTLPDATIAGRPNFQTLTTPLYPPPNNHHPHTIRGTSPSSYYSGNNSGYGYPGPGPSGQMPSGRSPLLPALNSLEQSHPSHSYHSQQQGPSHLRHEPGYHHPTPLPPIMGAGNTHTPPPSGTPPSYPSPPRHAQGPDDGQNQHDQHRSTLSQSHQVPVGSHSFSESRSSSSSNSEHPHTVGEKARNASSGIASGDSNTLPLPVGLGLRPAEFSTATHHNSYWDPVKSEAGE